MSPRSAARGRSTTGRPVFSCVKQGEAEAIAVREEGRSLPRSRSSGVKDGQRPRAVLHVPERLMAAGGSAGRASTEDHGCRVSLACLVYPAHAGGADVDRRRGRVGRPGRAGAFSLSCAAGDRVASPTRLGWFHQLRCSWRMRRNDGGPWTLAGELPGERCWRVMCWISAARAAGRTGRPCAAGRKR